MADFHFLYPYWLALIFPLLLLLWWLKHRQKSSSNWQQVIEPQLLQHLLIEEHTKIQNWPWYLAALTGLLAIFALANPVWEKKPQSVFQTPRALVLVLDLSASMNAADLKPSRMIRARLKVQDILKRETEGLIGLAVFAGDAFSVTPLTRDNETIISQLRVLEPDIMPAQGSRAELGLLKAGELLQQAGIQAGDILLIADGYESPQALLEARKLHDSGHRVSVLGIGTPEGAPISNGQGDVFKDENGIPILAKLDEERFKQLAQTGGGKYSRVRLDDADIDYLLDLPELSSGREIQDGLFQQHQWVEKGPYLTLLLLPLAALAFRRGWLLSIFLAVCIMPVPQQAMAYSLNEAWNDLWQTREQQASSALLKQQHEEAARLSSNPALIGSALYKQKRYNEALQQFGQLQGTDADYNRGNALARLGKYPEAINAYDKALKQKPDMQHAIENKAAVEALLKQMQQQDQKKHEQKQQKSEDQDNQQSDSEKQDQQQSSEQEQNQDNQQNQQAENTPQQGSEKSDTQQQADGNEQQSESDNQFADANKAMENEPTENKSADAQQNTENQDNKGSPPQQAEVTEQDQQASKLDNEEQLAAEQWLRRIPDDPGGLLKRKFLYQYQQRNRKPKARQAW